MQKHLITLSDSRTLEVYSAGTPSAQALVFHHGTPGSALSWQRWFAAVDQHGAFAISYSRPGYGESTRKKSRTVISNTQDISEMLKHFGIQKYVAIGWSGGGPHALADTTLDSCLAAITLAGVGAFGASDLDFLEGMGQENYDEFNAALNGEIKLDEWMQENSESMAEVTGPQLIEALGGLIGDADKRALDSDAAEKMAREFRHSLINGYTGWMDDDFAFIQDWGFEIGSINKPVEIWQGDDDFMVPHAHGKWLVSKIPHSKLVFVPGEGHISLGANRQDEILKNALNFLSA